MANEKIQISFGDMLHGIVREFSDALALVRRSHPAVTVRSVKLNIGQEAETELDPTEPTEPTRPASLLLRDRYPAIDKGWLMEVELGEGLSRIRSDGVYEVPELPISTALDLFGDYPLVAIKGIDTIWNRIFTGVDITRICHLARLDDGLLHELITSHHSLLPREFRRKAQLLEISIPPLSYPPDLQNQSLYHLLLMTAEALHQTIGREKISQSEVFKFLEFLEILNVVIDSEQLRQIKLSQLANV